MIFGDFIPLTNFLSPALSDEAELQNFVSLSLHTSRKVIAATVRHIVNKLLLALHKVCNAHVEYNCDPVRFLIP